MNAPDNTPPPPTTDHSAPEPDSPLQILLAGLRVFIMRSAILFAAAFVTAWIFRETLTGWLRAPLLAAFPEAGADTVLLRVIDAFMLHVKLCFFAALLVVVPFALYHIWQRVRAIRGGGAHSSRVVWLAMVLLFYLGVAFAHQVALPAAFSFLVEYSLSGEGLFFATEEPVALDILQVSMREHVDFTMKLLLAFGIGFESPIIMLLLAGAGLVTPQGFARNRGIALVVLAAASSMLTPPDPWTMLLLLVPLYILYEFGILLAKLAVRGTQAPGPAPTPGE